MDVLSAIVVSLTTGSMFMFLFGGWSEGFDAQQQRDITQLYATLFLCGIALGVLHIGGRLNEIKRIMEKNQNKQKQ